MVLRGILGIVWGGSLSSGTRDWYEWSEMSCRASPALSVSNSGSESWNSPNSLSSLSQASSASYVVIKRWSIPSLFCCVSGSSISMILVGVLALTCDGSSTSGGVGHWVEVWAPVLAVSISWSCGCGWDGGGVKPLSDRRAESVVG